MAFGDRIDVEFFLKRRAPWAWLLVEDRFRKYRLGQARIRCNNRAKSDDGLIPGIQGYCLFAGLPRSGHSVIGAVLNAHPNFLISHNLDALEYIRSGFSLDELCFLIQEREEQLAAAGRLIGGYSYAIPNLYQGDHRALRFIGDKRAGTTSRHLIADPGLLRCLPGRLGLPVYLIVHLRNPWDNISSIFTRMDIRKGRSLAAIIDEYFELLDGTFTAIKEAGSEVHVHISHHEHLIRDPETIIAGILAEFGIVGDDNYYTACRKFIHSRARQTRDLIPWTQDLIDRVAERMTAYPMLAHYTFGE